MDFIAILQPKKLHFLMVTIYSVLHIKLQYKNSLDNKYYYIKHEITLKTQKYQNSKEIKMV